MDPLLLQLFRDADEDSQLHSRAQGYFVQGDHIKALELIEDTVAIRGIENLSAMLHALQGSIFYTLAQKTENSDVKFTFLFGSLECFIEHCWVDVYCSYALFDMAQQLRSSLYYRKALKSAKESLYFLGSPDNMTQEDQDSHAKLENIIQVAESKIHLGENSEPMSRVSKDSLDTIRSGVHTTTAKRLRSYWAGLNVESKRNFLKVSTVKLTRYVERLYGREGQDALELLLDSARTNRKWKFWMCRTCSQKFFYLKKFKNHLEQQHAAKFKPSMTKHMAQRVDELWARMIYVGGWEPVDSVAAAEMIKTRLESVEKFVYENGWCKDWPLAVDENRSKLLKEIQLFLMMFCECKILSCSMRDWLTQFSVKHLTQSEVSEHALNTESHLVETPQIICFLECHELNQILDFLKHIKCGRHDGANLVRRAVESLWDRTRVKEKIEFDHQFSYMLLDKRLLKGKVASFDDEGTIDVCDHNVYYAKTLPQGDDIITWLLDYPLLDESFKFPRSIRSHNLDTWVAVLRVIHFTCRTLGRKYEKKLQILHYDAALIGAKDLCIHEDERRRNIPEDQWNVYASLLCDKCEEILATDVEDSPTTKLFLCAVRDVLEGESHPSFEFPDRDDCLKLINGHRNLRDDKVLKSLDKLKSVVADKVPLADSKILLVESSRINLLDDLIRLSVFDYRSYILYPLKCFLREELDGIVDIDAKSKAAAVETHLLSEKKQENQKKSALKNKKHRNKKITSTSMSSHHDQNVKNESSVNLEPDVASPSLKTTEEDSMESEDTVSSKMGREISSNTDNQEEDAKDMQNMPSDDSRFEHLESAVEEGAVRYNLVLAMTLKALCNIKVLKEYLVRNLYQLPHNLEEQVPFALQNFFSAFISKQIKEEGVYISLIHELRAALEEVHSMSSDAAELLISILEFCNGLKIPERESLITSHFTLEEYERMNCGKCKRKTNYREQSSYGIVMAADSIRDLKCAFGNIQFEGIVKVIHMEDKMLCDIKTGGCGKENVVHHVISRCPLIFTIVLEWEKNETEKEISETTKALNWEIDISRIYEGLEEGNTKYRLVSMVGCGEEEEYICLAYKKNRWFSYGHEGSAKEAVGNWKSVIRFCVERKIRSEILFYEAFQWPNK